jgi:hypothetical protein
MKTWHYEAFCDAINDSGRLGCVCQFPELSEALTANGLALHPLTSMKAVREICRLILAERKTTEATANREEAKELQRQLLDRDIYASRHDVAQCYRDYCEGTEAAGWLELSYWDEADHIGPVDYIAARISK